MEAPNLRRPYRRRWFSLMITGPFVDLSGHGRALSLATAHALQVQPVRKPGDAVAPDSGALPVHLPPDLLLAVDAKGLLMYGCDLDLQLLVTQPVPPGLDAAA